MLARAPVLARRSISPRHLRGRFAVMAHTLHYRDAGDAVLAICVAAQLSLADVKLKKASADQLPAGLQLPSPSAGLPALVTANGAVLQDANAAIKLVGAPAHAHPLSVASCRRAHLYTASAGGICWSTRYTRGCCRRGHDIARLLSHSRSAYAGGQKLVPPVQRAAVQQWLEYQLATLAPALLQSQGGAPDAQALKPIEETLQRQRYLTGQALTAADVRIGCCLLASGVALQGKANAMLEVCYTATHFDAVAILAVSRSAPRDHKLMQM